MSEDVFKRIAEEREACARRRRVIAEQISKLQSEDAALAKRDAELEHGERFVQSLLLPLRHPPPPLTEVQANVLSALEAEQFKTPKWNRRKPKDLPSVLQMADEAFAHFEADGQPWATAKDVAEFVRQKYWPDAKAEFFQGQLWRAANRGDIDKRGSSYARKGTKTQYEEGPDTDVPRPLLANGAADWSSA